MDWQIIFGVVVVEKIIIDKRILRRRYNLRRPSRTCFSWEVTVPREVVEREARLLNVRIENVEEDLEAEWRFNGFNGLHMVLVPKAKIKSKGRSG